MIKETFNFYDFEVRVLQAIVQKVEHIKFAILLKILRWSKSIFLFSWNLGTSELEIFLKFRFLKNT